MLSLFAHRLAHRCTRVKFPSFGGVHKQSNLASSNALVDKTPSSSNTDSELENGVEADYFLDGRQHSPHLKKSPILLTDNPIEKKIIYNSLAYSITVDKTPFIQRVKKHKEIMMKEQHSKNRAFLAKEVDSIVAKLMNSKTEKDDERCDNGIIENEKRPDEVSFPYQTYTPISRKVERFKSQLELEMENNLSKLVFSENTNYGTEDPSVAASETPCGGCGAFLHCQSASLPGYLPSEIFTSCDVHQLRGQICQRCRFLREHNVALSVQISPEDYPKYFFILKNLSHFCCLISKYDISSSRVISAIRNEIAMVILVVDLTDFPCSIWPGLLDIIGSKRPVCVVGNKVDLIPKDSKGYLNQMKQSLIMELEKCGLNRANIKHVSLISATTGYGVEQLITKIQNSWGYRGDVYLLGCTNVGKSSLFNALINSDFCKVQAIDVLERATVSPWPGTTLNLYVNFIFPHFSIVLTFYFSSSLKFPMLRPSGIRLYERTKRLLAEQTIELAEQKIRQEQLKETRNPKFATLIGALSVNYLLKYGLKNYFFLGHIGRTFDLKKSESEDVQDPFSIKADKVPGEEENIFNPNHKYYRESKWCYDTPGTVNPEQVPNHYIYICFSGLISVFLDFDAAYH